jgi:hypothetical protein
MKSFFAGVLLLCLIGCGENEKYQAEFVENKKEVETKGPLFSKEIERVLTEKIVLLKNLAQDPVVVENVRIFNKKNSRLSLSEILITDEKWKAISGIDDFIKSLLTNQCSQRLIDFQEEHDEFPEIFVTEAKGLIVGETNKTSDYYQADEQWWSEAYNGGKGRTFHGEIEYDESAMAESIPIYTPIMESENQEVIGIIKAVCDITAIKMEL